MHIVCGMRDLAGSHAMGRDSRDEPPHVVEAAEVKGMRADKKSAQNNGFDSNQSSKRKVPKGSDPIHNRT